MSLTESPNPFFNDAGIAAALNEFNIWATGEEREIVKKRDKYEYETKILTLAHGVILALCGAMAPEQIKAAFRREWYQSRYISELLECFDDLLGIEHRKFEKESFLINNPTAQQGYQTFCNLLTFIGMAVMSYDPETGKIADQFKQTLFHQSVAESLENDHTGITAVRDLKLPDLYISPPEFQEGFYKAAEIFVRVASTAMEQIIPDYDKA